MTCPIVGPHDCDGANHAQHAESVRVRDDGRVIVDVGPGLVGGGPGNWVRLIHQDHASYFIPPWEARSLAQRLLLAADAAEHIDGTVDT